MRKELLVIITTRVQSAGPTPRTGVRQCTPRTRVGGPQGQEQPTLTSGHLGGGAGWGQAAKGYGGTFRVMETADVFDGHGGNVGKTAIKLHQTVF